MQARRTFILGHGGKNGGAKTVLEGQAVDFETAMKAPEYVSGPIPLPPVVEKPKAKLVEVPKVESPKQEKKVLKKNYLKALPSSKTSLWELDKEDSLKIAKDLNIEIKEEMTLEAIHQSIADSLTLS